jgi:pimeloyl-ACP methyl ester carboxylesterase
VTPLGQRHVQRFRRGAGTVRRLAGSLVLAALVAAGCTDRSSSSDAATSSSSAAPSTAATGSSSSAPAATAAGTHPARFEKGDCRFEVPSGYDVSCGYLVTLQDRARPDGPEVRLHVGTFHKRGATVAEDPIVYLEGGPGGNALMGAVHDFDGRFGGYAASRDIVVFDQRGTGFSEPRLDCQELIDVIVGQFDSTAPPAQQLAEQQATLAPCRQALTAKGVDLSHYNSVDSAADLAELRQVLGYASWNVLGVSYGTRLAQTLLRAHPEGIRSVVLDSTFPNAVEPLSALPEMTAAAYQRFFDACHNDTACNAQYPDLASRFRALVDAMNRQPVTVTATDFITEKTYTGRVAGTTLSNLLFEALYSPVLFTAFPQLIADLEQRRTESLTVFVSNSISQLNFITLGVHLAVECNEEVPFADPDAVHRAAQAHAEIADVIAGQLIESDAGFETCRLWGAGRAGPEENQPVRSDVPTLIMSGGFDPITPGEWGRQVGQTLSRSTFVQFPSLGHGVSFEVGCPQQVMLAFVDRPTSPPDAACASQLPPPEFTPPAAGSRPIVLDDFTEDVSGVTITGKRPSGWSSQGSGTVATQRNLLNQAALLQQAAPGSSPSSLLNRLGSQLRLRDGFSSTETVDAGGVSWQLYHGTTTDSGVVDLALAQRSGTTLVALLVSSPSDRHWLYNDVLLPVLGALRRA